MTSRRSLSNRPITRRLVVEALEDRMLLSGGALDATFGTAGRVAVPGIGRTASAILQSDGKIVAVGGLNGDAVLQRFNADGSADTSFGINGRVIQNLGSNSDVAIGIVQQADGKLITAGFTTSTTTGNDFAISRFNTNGTVDSTFGTNGTVLTDFNSGNDLAADVVVQADGRIIAVGRTAQFGSSVTDFAIARYTNVGVLDASYGAAGKIVTDFGDFDGATRASLQTDGKLVAAGGSGFSVARYTTAGALDTTFATAGKFTLGTGGEANGLAILGNGRIVIGGSATDEGLDTFDFSLARLTTDGQLDATFGNGGQQRTSFGARSTAIFGIAIESDGKILATGSATTISDAFDTSDFILARYFSNGRLDTSFGTAGAVITDFGSDIDEANSVLVTPDGNYVEVGSAGPDTTGLLKISSSLPRQDAIPPVELYVTQVYADLLLREPDATGLTAYVNYLNQTPSSARFLPPEEQARFARLQMTKQFVTNLEFYNAEVDEIYADLLARDVDPSGRATWTGFLARGGSREQVEASVLGSTEFLQRTVTANVPYLEALYQVILGRSLDASGAATWNAAFAGGATRTQVAQAILESQESNIREVNLLYNLYLNRDADPAGLNSFVVALDNGVYNEQVIAVLTASDEYFGNIG